VVKNINLGSLYPRFQDKLGFPILEEDDSTQLDLVFVSTFGHEDIIDTLDDLFDEKAGMRPKLLLLIYKIS
jgi:hypothetical protein